MENSLSYYRNILLQEIEEKELSPKQKAIAKLDPPEDELDAGDFKAMQAGEKPKMENQEGQVDWPKEIPSKYADEFLFIYDESKPGFYNVQDVATGKMVGRVGFNTPEKAIEFAQDKIKPKGGIQSTQFEGDVDAFNDTQNYFGLKVGNKVTFKDSDKGEDSVALSLIHI